MRSATDRTTSQNHLRRNVFPHCSIAGANGVGKEATRSPNTQADRSTHPREPSRRFASWLVLALLASTIGCATVGHEFSPDRVPQITIGQTTKSDMRLMFGEPYRRGIDDGDSTWTYVHYKFRLFGEHMKTRDLLIRWDRDDRVRSYSYNSNME